MIKHSCFFLIITIICSSFQSQKKIDFSNPNVIQAFKVPDSLSNVSFTQLKNKYYDYKKTPIKASVYIKCYIKKSIAIDDSIRLARGYHLLSRLSNDSLKLIYLNQSISYTRSSTHRFYPALGYLEKGNIFLNKAKYKKALDHYFIAHEYAQKNNPELDNDIKFNIGIMKSRIGDHEEALKIFKECHDEYKKEKKTNIEGYLLSVFAISDAYTRMNKLDSATVLNSYGIKHSILQNHSAMRNYFVMNEGVNLYFKKKYVQSIDSLLKVMPFVLKEEDYSNIVFTRFYLGKAYLKSNLTEKALNQFKIVDTLLKEKLDFVPETRETYKILIEHYKTKQNTEKQLFYLNRLLKYDSILNANYKNVSNKIVNGFDTPQILLEKEKIINDLHTSNTNKIRWTFLLVFLFIAISLVLVYRNRATKKRYEKKFKQLIITIPKESPPIDINKEKNSIHSPILSNDIVTKIEKGLNIFISEKGYLDKSISINSLAKKMDSNAKYLSQYINHYEKKKFPDFINDLRVEYSIERIKNDTKFRKYTIKAISEGVGFSNPVSFSQAFFKKTGIKPSYFIKKLENTQ